MIEVKNVFKKYREIDALKDVSFKVNKNILLTILGPSGSGKTTLLRLIAGLESPDKGKILLDGKIVSTPSKIVLPYKRKISMIFQNLSLWPHMTVEQHLNFVLKDSKKIENMLDKVKLTGFKKRYPHQLSGGEKQRLAIARALITEPSYLLMDEPFSHLDFSLKKAMISLLLNLRKDLKRTIIYVTHNLDEVMALADKIIVMDKGKIIFQSNKEEFLKVHAKFILI